MAADIRAKFATVVTSTVTNLHSLGAGATTGWQSDVVDNSTNLYLDELVQIVISMSGTGTSGGDKGLTVYGYASIDGGTTYPEGITGTQGTFTFAASTARQLRVVGFIPADAISLTYKSNPMGVAKAFDGVLPERWGLAILNNTGITIAASGSTVKHQGVYGQTI